LVTFFRVECVGDFELILDDGVVFALPLCVEGAAFAA
jgi:hypothetical protein